MEVRDAEITDLEDIVAIYNATIPSRKVTADIDPVTVESRREWFKEHHPDFRPIWVVVEDKKIIGWLSYSSFYGRSAYLKTAVISVYVHEDHRRRGIGHFLIQKAISHAPKIGLDTLLGFIFAHNDLSLKLFSKLGFVQWGYLPAVALLDGVERDLIIVGIKVNI